MKTAIAAVLALSVAAPTAVSAKSPARHHHWIQTSAKHSSRHAQRSNVETNLTVALNAMVTENTIPPGQTKRPFDPDQGDDHASARAIFLVCNKHTPAARRSAICPAPVSPE